MQEPSLDHWTFIFLFAGAHGLFLAIVLFFQKKGRAQANQVLAAIMFLFGLTIFYYVAFWTGYIEVLSRVFRVILILPLTFGPLFLLYFKLLQREKISRRDAWHLLPFFLFFISNVPQYVGWEPTWSGTVYGPAVYYVRVILLNSHTLAYAAYFFVYLKKQQSHASLMPFQFRWMRMAAVCYAGFAVSLAMYYVLYVTIDFNITHDYAVSFFMSVFVYLAGYLGYRQPEALMGEVTSKKSPAPKYAKSGLTQTEATFHLKNITRFMEKERPYLDSELKMEALAQQLNLSKHTFSQIINDNLRQNFADFINRYRVEEAQRLLARLENQNEKILTIAYDAGFRNKASFYNAFNKHAGISPTRYRAQALASHKQERKTARFF
ncbi:MAG: helix-turn-helix domain-containing protein [Cyclobacteriaceae bacterium]